MTNRQPPAIAQRILRSFLRGDLAEEVQGDLDEKFYSVVKKKPVVWAKLNYWYQVINYVRPFAFRRNRNQTYPLSMYRNYIKIGWRNLLRNKSYVVINTFGLGISLACCITMYLMLAFNLEFDSFYDDRKVSDIYRFYTVGHEKGGRVATDMAAPIMLGSIAVSEVAGVEAQCRYLQDGGIVRYGDKTFNQGISFADSTFFDFFELPVVSGSAQSFKEKNSVFLTEEIAKKYFGDEDPVGKMMIMNFVNDVEIEVLVGGVVKKPPLNSTFFFDILMRFETFMDFNKLSMEDWSDWRNPTTFARVTSPELAAAATKQFNKYIPGRNKVRTDFVVERYELRPFKEVVYQSIDVRSSWVMMRVAYESIMMFLGLAVLILLIACFNLTNTSMAMTARRLKEVGVRKVIGASRRQIIMQFLLETMMIIVLSCALGFLLAQWIVPAFYDMWRLPFKLEDIKGLNLFVTLIILVFFVSVLAGIYPALLSSKFQPTALLKGSVRLKGSNPLTNTLVGAQFSLSVVVLVAGIVFMQNTSYQEKIKFGYDKDMIITVRTQGEKEFVAMQKAMLENPKVLSVGASDGNLGQNTYETPITVDTTVFNSQVLGVGENFFETMGIPLVEGRYFKLAGDTIDKHNVLVNDAFLQRTGLKDPIGRVIMLHGGRVTIIGVVANHLDNLYRSKALEAFVFYPAGRNQYISLLVKTGKDQRVEVQKDLEKKWKEQFPEKPFESVYQDDVLLGQMRQVNGNFEKMFLFVTVLGALLSVSGIYSLASQNISRRTREIGIRKALGASIRDIFGLLNREFVVVLSVAVVAGAVGGYYLTSYVLSSFFAHYITVTVWPLAACALTIFVLGVSTTSVTIIKAARSNPVDTLKVD
jgi:putative ABC transport system permease protein